MSLSYCFVMEAAFCTVEAKELTLFDRAEIFSTIIRRSVMLRKKLIYDVLMALSDIHSVVKSQMFF